MPCSRVMIAARLFAVVVHQLAEGEQHLGALADRALVPARGRGGCRLHGQVDDLGCGERDRCHQLPGGRLGHLAEALRRGGVRAAANPVVQRGRGRVGAHVSSLRPRAPKRRLREPPRRPLPASLRMDRRVRRRPCRLPGLLDADLPAHRPLSSAEPVLAMAAPSRLHGRGEPAVRAGTRRRPEQEACHRAQQEAADEEREIESGIHGTSLRSRSTWHIGAGP